MKFFLLSLMTILLSAASANAERFTIYYDNSATAWESVGIHYWGAPQTEWPGVEIDHVEGDIWAYTFPVAPTKVSGFLFKHATKVGGEYQTADCSKAPVNNHLYKGAGGAKGKVAIPWFALGFLAVIGFNSFNLLPAVAVDTINYIDTFLLTMAMTALGAETNIEKFKKAGAKPFVLALILYGWLMIGGYALVKFVAPYLL